MRIIYDVGAGDGEDIEYYLRKSDLLVSIDANPFSIRRLENDFRGEISSGRLRLVNCAIDSDPGEIDFQVNHKCSALSRRDVREIEVAQFGELASPDAWESIRVPSAKLTDIIKTYGTPFAIKIDIEGAEDVAMRDLFFSDIRPRYLSNELGYNFHACACYMYLMGYRQFQMINMNRIQDQFCRWPIKLPHGGVEYFDFLQGCSGPIGEDLSNDWMDFERFCFFLSCRTLIFGQDQHWYDVHVRS